MLSDADFQFIRSTGVTVLDNSWCAWNGLTIGGLSSAQATDYQRYRSGKEGRYPKPEYTRSMTPIEPETAWPDAFEQQPGYHILLSHHPEYWESYLINRHIDLVFSGHAHGGQIRVFDHGLYAPDQGLWAKYTRGMHHHGPNGSMIISTGLSNTGGIVPPLFNPREIVYIRLEN